METFDIDLEPDIDEDIGGQGAYRLPLRLSLRDDVVGIGNAILTLRALRSLDHGVASYPIHRQVHVAARRPVADPLDGLALRAGLAAHRLGEAALLLDGAGVLVSVRGRRKSDYSSVTFAIWADSMDSLESVRDRLLALVDERRVQEVTFTIDWHFTASHSGSRVPRSRSLPTLPAE